MAAACPEAPAAKDWLAPETCLEADRIWGKLHISFPVADIAASAPQGRKADREEMRSKEQVFAAK